jgi:hypothetical protein
LESATNGDGRNGRGRHEEHNGRSPAAHYAGAGAHYN